MHTFPQPNAHSLTHSLSHIPNYSLFEILGNHRNFIRHKLYKEVSEELTEGWRNLHKEELLHWYSS